MFNPGYRWFYRPKYFWLNIVGCWHDLTGGIRNIFKWLPVIWFDRDWDYVFLLRLLQFKLGNMADCFEKNQIVVDADEMAAELRECVEAIKRIQADEYHEPWYSDYESLSDEKKRELWMWAGRSRQSDVDFLCNNMSRNLLKWWD